MATKQKTITRTCPIVYCKKKASFDDETGEYLCEEHTEELHDEIDNKTEEVINDFLEQGSKEVPE